MKNFLLLCLVCLFSYGLFAQDSSEEEEWVEDTETIKYPMFFGIGGQALLPLGAFGEKMQQPGYLSLIHISEPTRPY